MMKMLPSFMPVTTSKRNILTMAAATCLMANASPIVAQSTDANEDTEPNIESIAPSSQRPVIEPWGYPLEAFDQQTRPQDDFYRYANGGWLDNNAIPNDRSGIGFSVTMRERNEQRMTLIINALKNARVRRGTPQQQIRDLYLGFMDDERIENLALRPFRKDLARIARLNSYEGLARTIADPVLGLSGPFSVSVAIDSKNPEQYALWASHSGLSMPDRTYYLRDSERLKTTREGFKTYIYNILNALQEATADNSTTTATLNQRSTAVFELEKAIAALHWTRAERRNASRTYNAMTVSELQTLAPSFPWQVFMEGFAPGTDTKIVVREKEAFPTLARLFASTPLDVWQDYLRVQYVTANAQFMPKQFDELRFSFFGKVISGQQVQRGRDRRAINIVDARLNQAIGKIYIENFFPEESKALMTEMFENIRTAFRTRIENLNWMTAETKKQAIYKLDNVNAKIAYPDVWRDYSKARIRAKDLFGSIKNLRRNEFEFSKANLGRKVDKNIWFRGPQTVNAFYSPTRNEAFIPAGYIQSPLFDPHADPALNYGAIGSIIGHEIGHGFDDQGSKYDARGVLKSWWTQEDRAAFDSLGDKLAAQFDQYEPLPGLFVNGRQTLGENIGDLAGMTVAYHAYLLSLDGEEPPVLDGLTGKQRFFLGRAQGRRFKRTEASLRRRLLSAPHSPMYLRVNGMIRNMDEWYKAYNVKEGDELYIAPENRVRIW